MSFHCTRKLLKFDYFLDGPNKRVNQVKDLWFLYVPSLDFQPHIDFFTCFFIYLLHHLLDNIRRISTLLFVFMPYKVP